MRKAITPIIAIIILLLITVALAGAAFTFLQGFLFPQISKSFSIPPGGAYCTTSADSATVSGFSRKIIIYVLNTAYQSQLEAGDFIVAAIDGTSVLSGISIAGTSIPTSSSAKILEYDCDTPPTSPTACENNDPSGSTTDYSGPHNIDLGTVSGIQHFTVFCP